MDYIGIIRRLVGATGAFLVAFGVATAEEAASLAFNFEAIIGGVLMLVDLIPSLFGKIRGKVSG